jgi:hypothetical protein
VREHRTLAAPGGAAGVEDGRQVVAAARRRRVRVGVEGGALEQRAAAVVAEREHVARAGGKGDLAERAEARRRAHQHRRLGVAEEVLDLGRLVGAVQRQVDMAGAQHRQVQDERLDALVDLHRDPARRRQLQAVEQVGDHRAGAVEVAPAVAQRRVRAVGGFDGDAVQVGREGLAQGGEQVHGVGGGGFTAGPARCASAPPRPA